MLDKYRVLWAVGVKETRTVGHGDVRSTINVLPSHGFFNTQKEAKKYIDSLDFKSGYVPTQMLGPKQ
jgi:hypothetical protein